MNKKILLVIIPLLLVGMFSVTKAATIAELQTQISALQAQIAALRAQLAQLQKTVNCPISSFTSDLSLGSLNEEVKCLQKLLNSDPDTQLASSGPGSPGNETTYFGPLTQAALIKSQKKYGITNEIGYVGTTTREKLNALYEGAINQFTSVSTFCIRDNPILLFIPNSQSGNAGTELTYSTMVQNKDTGCDASIFLLSITSCPAGWTCSINATSTPQLGPLGSGNNTYYKEDSLHIKSPCNAPAGEYVIKVEVVNNSSFDSRTTSSATYIASTPGVAQTLIVTKSKTGNGTGSINSVPDGIDCGIACPTSSRDFDCGTPVTLNANPESDSTFIGWSGDCSQTDTCIVTMDSPKNVTATFNIKDSICIHNRPGISFLTDNPATADPGVARQYQVRIENRDSNGCGPADILVNCLNYGYPAIDWECSGGGWLNSISPGNSATTIITVKSPKNAPASPPTYNSLLSAVNMAATSSPLQEQANVGLNIASYNLTVNLVRNGWVQFSTSERTSAPLLPQERYPAGTSVSLVAFPASGYVFAGWSGGGCIGTEPCTITMRNDITITATFNLSPVLYNYMSVSKNGNGFGTVTSSPAGINCGTACLASFPTGSTVTLTATPAPESAFTGWTGVSCQESVVSNTCTITMNADIVNAQAYFNSVVPAGPEGRTNWKESCGIASKGGCSCSTMSWACGGRPSCTYTCPARAHATVSSSCTYSYTGLCEVETAPSCNTAIDCREGFSCDLTGGNCSYTCNSGWKDGNNNMSNGCETAVTASTPNTGIMESMLASIADAISKISEMLKTMRGY